MTPTFNSIIVSDNIKSRYYYNNIYENIIMNDITLDSNIFELITFKNCIFDNVKITNNTFKDCKFINCIFDNSSISNNKNTNYKFLNCIGVCL